MRVIVTGMIASYPVGGVVWDYGQYALGLEQLGCEVHYLEDTGWQTYDPRTQTYGDDHRYAVDYLGPALTSLSPTLGQRWCFRGMDGSLHGPDAARLIDLVASADVFLNVSGGTLLRPEYAACPRKVLIDTDPGWNHFVNYPKWDANPGWQGSLGWRAHDHFFTYAERIGRPDCTLPSLGIDWKPTRPPVVLDCWRPEPPGDTWTTVMTWDNFRKPIVHEGITYGTKELEFQRIEDLPMRVPVRLEVAAGGEPPIERWKERGWSVIDSHAASATSDCYRAYVQRSRGEFSVAKNLYTATRSGWFSCRSVCYLAAGRPVVIQNTGFTDFIPSGDGLFAFETLDEAQRGILEVEADYARHSASARRLAAEHFDARLVIGDMLTRVAPHSA